MDATCTSPLLASEIVHTTLAWIDDPLLPSYYTPCDAIQQYISLGWLHFLMGKVHKDITAHQKCHYTSLGIQRQAQSLTSQLIVKLWTVLLRLVWTLRNSTVHTPNGYAPSHRLSLFIQKGVRKIYTTTDSTKLHPHDQDLLPYAIL